MAGAVFGLEVLAFGNLSYDAIAPCFLSAFFGDMVTRAWATRVPGVAHTIYTVGDVPALSVPGIFWASLAGIAFGLTAMFFANLTHAITRLGRRIFRRAELRPVLGGVVVTVAVLASGSTRYIGLGIPVISSAFHQRVPPWDFLAKIAFTTISIGTGFKGGEVTPLFFVGATLGNTLSRFIPLPTSLLAAMGFAGIFAGAANTPIASTLMAVELFGGEAGAYAAIACVMSYLFSGHVGIYTSQRVGRSKTAGHRAEEGLSLALVAKARHEQEAMDEATEEAAVQEADGDVPLPVGPGTHVPSERDSL
jgi:H+/Cl- antiporter ClcA